MVASFDFGANGIITLLEKGENGFSIVKGKVSMGNVHH